VSGQVPEQIDVLLVEDSDSDARLVKYAFEELGENATLFRVRDGREAIRFLNRQEPYEKAPRPRLVLLDINLPGTNGHQVLQHLKSMREGPFIPVVIFSSSVNPSDLQEAYDKGANAYIRKPMDLNELVGAVQRLNAVWLRLTATAAIQ
jgi:two-component system, chemotaxis family, response regulator Rcp1